MQALRPEVTSIVDSLLDEMIAGPRPTDLVRSFSLLLPSRVICSLLGVPPGDLDSFHGWSNTLFADWSRTMEEMAAAYAAINGYMAELVARKRKEPADDLISVLIAGDGGAQRDREQRPAHDQVAEQVPGSRPRATGEHEPDGVAAQAQLAHGAHPTSRMSCSTALTCAASFVISPRSSVMLATASSASLR